MFRRTLLSLAVIVPAGFYSKFYRGPAAFWVHDSLGGVFYEIFWCLAAFLVWPRVTPRRVAAAVFAGTCALEFLQLWHPPWLEFLRSFFPGRTILGTDFDWTDFAYYAAGSTLGWLWLEALRPRADSE